MTKRFLNLTLKCTVTTLVLRIFLPVLIKMSTFSHSFSGIIYSLLEIIVRDASFPSSWPPLQDIQLAIACINGQVINIDQKLH